MLAQNITIGALSTGHQSTFDGKQNASNTNVKIDTVFTSVTRFSCRIESS
jgi:hypothetical protein